MHYGKYDSLCLPTLTAAYCDNSLGYGTGYSRLFIQASRGRVNKVKLRMCGSARLAGTWGSKVIVHFSITSVLDGSEWLSSRPGLSNPRMEAR
jgi:hypothetical protein